MRPISIGTAPTHGTLEQKVDWLIRAMARLEKASFDDTAQLFDEFEVTNVTETTTFDADVTSLDELADIVGTLITKFKERLA